MPGMSSDGLSCSLGSDVEKVSYDSTSVMQGKLLYSGISIVQGKLLYNRILMNLANNTVSS